MLRTALELFQDLEGFILKFFQGLPCATTIICIGEGFTSLVREILEYPHPVHAWTLLSRFNGNGQPVALLLPVDSIKDDDGSFNSSEDMTCFRPWHCPWGHTVVDQVAPVFKQTVNCIHALGPGEDTREKKELQDREIKKVDQGLKKLMETPPRGC